MFFKILDVGAFKIAMAQMLVGRVTTASVAHLREFQIRDAKQEGRPGRLPLIGLNVGFTHAGLGQLLAADQITDLDEAFAEGATARAAALLDPTDDQGRPKWKAQFASDEIHGVFLITGPDEDSVEHETRYVRDALGAAIKVVYQEHGKVRPQRAHEHFGFLDGVSQPGVRGLTARQNPIDPNQGLPGQELLWPGEFVFGYPGQDENRPVAEPGPEPPMPHAWMRNGSYMVFRRLEQRVPEFHGFLETEAARLGMDAELLGARLVGRWRSGAPLMVAPLQDDPELAADPLSNNAFKFAIDRGQRRCPFAAHIRKTYPRDDIPEPGVQTRRIMRAGIPFGPEVGDDEAAATTRERGLMFVCYQTSIVDQFEFIQTSWANSNGFVFGKTRPDTGEQVRPGHDPIIGQAEGARFADEPVPNYPTGNTRSQAEMPEPFIVPTAAGYFFMPSISALRSFCA